MKIALPVSNNLVSEHFGHCEKFYIADIADGKVISAQTLTPPPHEPGVIPKWLADNDVSVVITGGMGPRAIQLLESLGIKVIIGIRSDKPEDILKKFLDGNLESGENVCDH